MSDRPPLAFDADDADDGARLEKVLRRHLPALVGAPVGRSVARRLIGRGAVRIDGRVARRASRRVAIGERIGVDADRGALAEAAERRRARVDLSRSRVLHLDEHVLAVDKPAGVPTHATADSERDHLVAAAARLLDDLGRPGRDVTAAHRLDASTSGVVLLALDAGTAAALGEAFRSRRVHKAYDAIVHAPHGVQARWTVDRPLRHDPRRGHTRGVRSGGDPARTDFEHVASRGDRALVRAFPRTGRTHQIRVHLADDGTPILGDRVYAPPAVAAAAPRLLLHAARLELPHPVTGEPLHVVAPPPPDLALER